MYHQGTYTFVSRYRKGLGKPYYLKRESLNYLESVRLKEMKICWFCVIVVCLVLNVVFQPGVNKVSTRWHAATCNIPHVFTSTEDLR